MGLQLNGIKKEYRKKLNKDDINIRDFRKECRDFAAKWIEVQKKSFIRLFVLADWNNPYPHGLQSGAIILKNLVSFLDGSLYRGSKPIMWSQLKKLL